MHKNFKWSIDQAHSEISFKVKHLMIAYVKGTFTRFDASIYSTDKNISSSCIDLWIDASSISTGDPKRDEHLKSSDFLDVMNHKQISFVSGSIGEADLMGNAELWGDFTMNGITKNIKLNLLFGGMIVDPWGNEKAGFTVSGTINRKDYGLVWNTKLDNGGIMVGDEVMISCEMEVIYQLLDPGTMEIESDEAVNGSI